MYLLPVAGRLLEFSSALSSFSGQVPNWVLELNETEYQLGSEDPSSFGRAIRTWEGIPPSDWRETHRSYAVM